MLPADAPDWVQGIGREALWNAVDAGEKRKDSQTARELEIMVPREVPPDERAALVRDYFLKIFVSKGMIVDVCWHNKIASDSKEHPHVHALITLRPLTPSGFGPKARHDWVPDPQGRAHPDGRPVMVVSNPDSWNCPDYFEQCRKDWETIANDALDQAGSSERIDRRSLLARGLSRLPEPALRLAFHLKELRGVMQERFGQFQYAKFYNGVQDRAKEALSQFEQSPFAVDAAQRMERFHAWFDRTIERLAPARDGPEHEPPMPPTPEMER